MAFGTGDGRRALSRAGGFVNLRALAENGMAFGTGRPGAAPIEREGARLRELR